MVIAESRATITSLKLNKKEPPKQPIPDLNKTAERYLKSVKPLLSNDEYCTTENLLKEFISKEGPILHEKLLKRYECTDNWMNKWWLNAAYLGYRYPVIVHSSPGTVTTEKMFENPQDTKFVAAKLIRAVCEYDIMVKKEDMKQEMMRDIPLDMQPYGMILGTHRRPDFGLDQLLHTDKTDYIVIICKNHFYKLQVMCNGKAVDEGSLSSSIEDIINRSSQEGVPVGVLTGNDRDTWAQVHSQLRGLGNNKKILDDIENSLFVLCLDKAVPKDLFGKKNAMSVRAVQSLTGLGKCVNSGNRWHDKIVQYIVSEDGFIGMEYEHSPCEGVPVAVLHDFVINYIKKRQDASPNSGGSVNKPEELQFQLNSQLQDAIKKAEVAVDKLTDDIDMECHLFDKFGSDEIKKAKMSPDSFIQMAMQATYYKLHGKPPAHYESAGLRRFRNARTECIRSTSIDSVEFAKIMCSNKPLSDKKNAMIKAINTHKQLAGEAAAGEGVDRHFFGMKMIAIDEKREIPAIYKDAGFTRSTGFTLTSSQVPYKTASFMCYGPVMPNGYGCCYNPQPNKIFLACSSFASCSETSTKDFADAMQETLCEMLNAAKCQ